MAALRGAPLRHTPAGSSGGGIPVLDLLLPALGLGIFALLAAYALGCERV
ncbi:MAG: hypothetical protein ACOYOH_06835 [Paracraurococcus sp.]|jgi:hypothetical protein